MSDGMFSVGPFVALVACMLAATMVWRHGSHRRQPHASTRQEWCARWVLVTSIGLVALQHLLLLAAPNGMLRWNSDLRRLIAFEAVGVAAGCGCVAAALIALWRHLSDETAPDTSIRRTLMLSIAAVVTLSGLTTALAYRWASSWSVVTLTAYVASLATVQPRVELVTSMPFPVRLHVVGAFAALALLPFANPFAAAVVAARRSVRALATAVARLRVARAPLDTAALGAPSAVLWSEEEQ